MERQVKIVIGANYGDEGKGLMSRYFTKKFVSGGENTVTVFHNGSAQRGHTADYEYGSRHVFHNFAAGAKEGAVTYYADSFLVHPMDFRREASELGFCPPVYCDPSCVVVTPFDMIADHIIEDHIESKRGREYGSCGYGTWSTTERIKERPDIAYTVDDMLRKDRIDMMQNLRNWMYERIVKFGVDLATLPEWSDYLKKDGEWFYATYLHFTDDLLFFLRTAKRATFSDIWLRFKNIVFEGAQGLLLDKDSGGEWVTTSNTGIQNPARILSGYSDFNAEVCYVSRSYVTRHGDGPLSGESDKRLIGEIREDRTNVFNPFQGKLRYAGLSKKSVLTAIEKDMSIVSDSSRFRPTIAFTHCNETGIYGGDYRSNSPCEVLEN